MAASSVPLYPLFLSLAGQPVLVVGGGAVALRKAKGLVECGAKVTAVGLRFAEGFEQLAGVERIKAPYASVHMRLDGWRLVFAATDDAGVNAKVRGDAAAAGILCCRCDEPEEGDFSGGAVARLGEGASGVTVAISTDGASPVLARRIREQAAGGIDPMLIQLVGLLASWRGRVKAEVGDGAVRRGLLERLAGDEMEAIVRVGGVTAGQGAFERWLDAARQSAENVPVHEPGRI